MAPTEERIQVIVRCRPMNELETKKKCKSVLSMSEQSCVISKLDGQRPGAQDKKVFTYDKAYSENTTTQQIYHEIVSPVIRSVTEGYNGTIFAYGQTSCGKTYTMQGVPEPETQHGIIPRAIQDVFKVMSTSQEQFMVHASCYEIYNEDIRDLLGKKLTEKLDIGSFPNKGFYVKGLSKHPVTDVQQCERLITKGLDKRSTGSTLMNSESSRSHTVFTVCVEAQGEGEHIRAGKLNLVDLAGSERQSKSGATGNRLREGIKINLSLSTLGKVISILAEGKQQHVPYRDSKLTKLLQDSLGGTARTLMVACVSPADYNYEETLSTLRFASRAKTIVNKPVINEDPKDALLREYQVEIRELKAKLADAGSAPSRIPDTELQALIAEMEKKREEEYQNEKAVMQMEYERKLSEMARQLEEAKKQQALMEEKMARKTESQNLDDTGGSDDIDSELRIVLIGKTGSGKSATGNTIAGSIVFESKASFVSITSVSKCHTAYHENRAVFVVDTPGLFDTLETNEERRNEIMKCVALTSPGIHAILFVIQIGRFTEEEQKTLEFYKEYFGPRVVDYMIIVFTRQDNLEHDGMTLHEHLQGASPVLQGLIRECQNRYIAVNNRANDGIKRQFRRNLVRLIDMTVAGNGGTCYTNDMFDVAESIMKSEEQSLVAEVEEEKRVERDAIEMAQSELLLKEREELERKAEEERRKQEEEMEAIMLEMDQMFLELRQNEERKIRLMKEEQERKVKELKEQSEEQIQKTRELKARLETENDEERHVHEQELRAAQEKAEELKLLRERDLEAARLESERQIEEERRRVEHMRQEKEKEMMSLQERARAANEKLREEDEKLARVVQKIFQQDYEAHIKKIEMEARMRARREAAAGKSVFKRVIEGVWGSAKTVYKKTIKKAY